MRFLDWRIVVHFQNLPVEMEGGPEEWYGNDFCSAEGKSAL